MQRYFSDSVTNGDGCIRGGNKKHPTQVLVIRTKWCNTMRIRYWMEQKMKPFLFLLVVFTAVLAGAQKTNSCRCACVNGEVKALCSSSIDVPPVCAPRVCPIVTPSVKPVEPPRVPPVGTSKCTLKQVYNERTKKYEWKSVCQ